jgi:hypothetical protein
VDCIWPFMLVLIFVLDILDILADMAIKRWEVAQFTSIVCY